MENASSVAALQMFSQRSIQSPQFNSEQQRSQSPVYYHIKCEIRSQSDFCPLAVAYTEIAEFYNVPMNLTFDFVLRSFYAMGH